MKLIAIDLDGTLLNSNHEITEENIEAIKKVHEEGNIVMICSGRPPESIKEILELSNLSCPIAASNGTVVYTEDKLLNVDSFKKEDVLSIVHILDEEFIPYDVYTNEGVFLPNDWTERTAKVLARKLIPKEFEENALFEYSIVNPKEKNVHVKDLGDKNSFYNTPNQQVQKFYISTLIPEQKERLWKSLSEIPTISLTSSAPFNIEVMTKEGNKGKGLKTMASHFNIPMENTIAIGDNFNDVPMFKVAGLSIAMGNAEEKVKTICVEVTLSNDESGVAKALQKHVLTQ